MSTKFVLKRLIIVVELTEQECYSRRIINYWTKLTKISCFVDGEKINYYSN